MFCISWSEIHSLDSNCLVSPVKLRGWMEVSCFFCCFFVHDAVVTGCSVLARHVALMDSGRDRMEEEQESRISCRSATRSLKNKGREAGRYPVGFNAFIIIIIGHYCFRNCYNFSCWFHSLIDEHFSIIIEWKLRTISDALFFRRNRKQ